MQQLRARVEVWVEILWQPEQTMITVYRVKPFLEPRASAGRLVHLLPDDALQFINQGALDNPYRVVAEAYPDYFVVEVVQDD